MTFICNTCGKEHDVWPPDRAAKRPDEIWDLPIEDRKARVQENDDLCVLDGSRFFIRAVLPISLQDQEGVWGLGLWVEVPRANFDRYYELYDADATHEPGFIGHVANSLPYFPGTRGLEVKVKLGIASKRPTLWCAPQSEAPIAIAQQHGVSDAELHRMLALDA